MNRMRVCVLIGLAAACFACGSEEGGAPSIVGHPWEIRVAGTEQEVPPASEIEFMGLGYVEVLEDARFERPPLGLEGPYLEPQPPPLVLLGDPRFTLPPRPLTLDEVDQSGVKLIAMSYCAFINQAGVPRDEDVAAVEEAVSLLVNAIEEPARSTPLTTEGLIGAWKVAEGTILEDVLDELRDRGTADPSGASMLVRRLESSLARAPNTFNTLEELVDLLTSIVWELGDATLRANLRGCGSLILFDIPEELRYQELPSQFPGNRCIGNNIPPQTLACSLDAFRSKWTYGRDEAMISLFEPFDARDTVIWRVTPLVSLWDRPRL